MFASVVANANNQPWIAHFESVSTVGQEYLMIANILPLNDMEESRSNHCLPN